MTTAPCISGRDLAAAEGVRGRDLTRAPELGGFGVFYRRGLKGLGFREFSLGFFRRGLRVLGLSLGPPRCGLRV